MKQVNKLLKDRICHSVVIYGAGLMGKALKTCLDNCDERFHIERFVVNSIEGNPDEIDGIPVISIDDAVMYKNSRVFVALHEKHLYEAIDELAKRGFVDIVPISFDGDLWSDIRSSYISSRWRNKHRDYIKLDEAIQDIMHIYVVHSIYDKPLRESIMYSSHEIPIQVGKALTDKKICEVTDDLGDNISKRNRRYSELTALYWIWKHDHAKYSGLSHYRRKFCLDDTSISIIAKTEIDVIMTVPIINFNTVRGQYCMDHSEEDWNILSEAVQQLYPEYMYSFNTVEGGNWYYAYNMFIARKEILNEYCSWLFPILEFCDEHIKSKEDVYQERYAGFLSERLQTVFFLHNERRFKTVIGEKHFFETL